MTLLNTSTHHTEAEEVCHVHRGQHSSRGFPAVSMRSLCEALLSVVVIITTTVMVVAIVGSKSNILLYPSQYPQKRKDRCHIS